MAKRMEEKHLNRQKASYLVIPNPIIKMMLKGINLVLKPNIPQTIFSDKKQPLILLMKK